MLAWLAEKRPPATRALTLAVPDRFIEHATGRRASSANAASTRRGWRRVCLRGWPMKKRRADERLYKELNLESLSLARALIMEGRAFAGERKLKSPGELVSEKEAMRVRGALDRYVSSRRAQAQKGPEVFSIDVAGEVCVDVGASTGGFTDVLLRAGARHVYAVDVGYNLLDYRLRADARVTAMERGQRPLFAPGGLFHAPNVRGDGRVVYLPERRFCPALSVLDGPHRRFVALVKPQF